MTTPGSVETSTEYGNDASFWVEYPSGLVDVSRSHHLSEPAEDIVPPPLSANQLDIPADGGHTVRVDKASTAIVIIDMQK
jgi:hypothetical protein